MSLVHRPMARAGALVVGALVLLVAIALWLPAMSTPFWGDDYMFLEDALRARLSGDGWLAPFWPDRLYQFWRPLGHETYWRFVEQVLKADEAGAHRVNFALWLLGCAAVGSFAAVLSKKLQWPQPMVTGAMAGAVYSILALHFTPLHWTSSADSLLIVIASALALTAWTAASLCAGRTRVILYGSVVLMQAVALFSKESAVVLPALMLCVTGFIGFQKPERGALLVLAACITLIGGWLFLRQQFVFPLPHQYEPRLGWNVLRNVASLCAWMLNIPREALRMLVIGPRDDAVLWMLAAGLPMLLFVAAVRSALARSTSGGRTACVVAFVLTAYAPYVLLAWQSYEYYAQVAAILPVALAAHACVTSRVALGAVPALCLSSAVSVEGSRWVGYPGLIARANLGEEQIESLVADEMLSPALTEAPFAVSVTNQHRFYAIGRAGLAWRLGRAPGEVALAEQCTAESARLLEIQEAKMRLRDCIDESLAGLE